MDAIQLPIVWLDCDMEFHKFPKKVTRLPLYHPIANPASGTNHAANI